MTITEKSIQKKLTYTKIRKWATQFAPERIVGTAGMSGSCPVSVYLRDQFPAAQRIETGLREVHVATAQGELLIIKDNVAATRLAAAVDSFLPVTNPRCRAQDLLLILDYIESGTKNQTEAARARLRDALRSGAVSA